MQRMEMTRRARKKMANAHAFTPGNASVGVRCCWNLHRLSPGAWTSAPTSTLWATSSSSRGYPAGSGRTVPFTTTVVTGTATTPTSLLATTKCRWRHTCRSAVPTCRTGTTATVTATPTGETPRIQHGRSEESDPTSRFQFHVEHLLFLP